GEGVARLPRQRAAKHGRRGVALTALQGGEPAFHRCVRRLADDSGGDGEDQYEDRSRSAQGSHGIRGAIRVPGPNANDSSGQQRPRRRILQREFHIWSCHEGPKTGCPPAPHAAGTYPTSVLDTKRSYASRPSARVSSARNRSSSASRPASIARSSASGAIASGSPIAIATVDHGFGICDRSQLFAVEWRSEWMWKGRMGLPVALASQMAPGCAIFAGPRGPASVNAAGRPAAMSRFSWTSAFTAPRDVDPRAVPYPKRSMMPAIHSPSKFSLVMTTMPRRRK